MLTLGALCIAALLLGLISLADKHFWDVEDK
jgi:hypothetical protein